MRLVISPLTLKTWRRFKSIRRGYWSAIVLLALLFISLFSELIANNRALLVYYEGNLTVPVYGAVTPGIQYGLNYEYETNYRELKRRFQAENNSNWMLMPIIPYGPYETTVTEGNYPPEPPNFNSSHYLGTDIAGRDIASRLLYGFRIAIFFSLILLVFNYAIGITLGCIMGYRGGAFDLLFQRLIEIWSNVPILYVIMIIASIVTPSFMLLILIMVMFGWMSMTWYMRTATYKEKSRDYVMAAKALGASTPRILFKHILPNTISIIVTFVPFSIVGGIGALTSLDYLGFGLPAPTPSWGEMLRQGTDNLHAPWISISVVTALVVVLTMVTFVGEAVREAYDPKKHAVYE